MDRSITVPPDVFSLIWAHWREGDKDESDILRRTLAKDQKVIEASSEVNISEPSKSDQEVAMRVSQGGPSVPPNRHRPIDVKIRWVDDVVRAFRDLDGEADLSAIYRRVEEIRRDEGRRVVKTLDETIRQTIESHSSDSKNFERNNPNGTRRDLFARVALGRWKLRERG